MRTRVVAVAAAVAATLLAVAGPARTAAPPAPRAGATLVDGTGDLWVIGPGEDVWHPFDHRRPGADLTGATVRHGAQAIVATFSFVDLRVGHWQDFSMRVRSDRPFRRAIVTVDPDHPGGTDRLLNLAEDRLTCPGLRHHVDYDADTVRIRLARECVGDPTWVRVALAAYLFRSWDTIGDNPHNAGAEPDWTRRLAPASPTG